MLVKLTLDRSEDNVKTKIQSFEIHSKFTEKQFKFVKVKMSKQSHSNYVFK
jgi:hypothetical protein